MKNNLLKFSTKNKIIVFIVLSIFLTPINMVYAKSPNKLNINVNARSAIAMDAKTKRVLYEKNPHEPIAMASTTKIMTSLVALNYGNLEKEITISKNAASVKGSHAGYKAGEEISEEELLYGLMLRSGNDAAIALAEGIAGSVDKFCSLMNEYAYSIGALDSHFESPHGLDSENHYSSPYDLALITAKAKEIDKFNEIVSCKKISFEEKNFSREYNNINKILWKIPEANGVKTGYTGGAGKCLVTSVDIDGNDVIIVVLNSPTRWEETKKIYNFVKENYNFEKVVSKEEVLANIKINKKDNFSLVCNDDIVIPIKNGEQYDKKVQIRKDLNKFNIDKGEEIGTLLIQSKTGDLIYKQSLISDRDIVLHKNKFFKFNKNKK